MGKDSGPDGVRLDCLTSVHFQKRLAPTDALRGPPGREVRRGHWRLKEVTSLRLGPSVFHRLDEHLLCAGRIG